MVLNAICGEKKWSVKPADTAVSEFHLMMGNDSKRAKTLEGDSALGHSVTGQKVPGRICGSMIVQEKLPMDIVSRKEMGDRDTLTIQS